MSGGRVARALAVALVAAVALAGALVAGCNFRIGAVAFDAGAGGDDLPAIDVSDFSVGSRLDLLRHVPDGAVPRGLGFPCDVAGDCDSGNCIDGYCCDSGCEPGNAANLCKACNVPGSEGHCAYAPAGTDPHQQCEPDPVASCGKDGLCDGAGACRRYPAGTSCAAPSCAGDDTVSARTCDGNGSCLPGKMTMCSPYTCNPMTATCYARPCLTDKQCAQGHTCNTSSGKCM